MHLWCSHREDCREVNTKHSTFIVGSGAIATGCSGKPEAAHRALDYTLRAFASGDEINGYGQEETVLLRWPEASLETFPDGSQRKPQWL